jgi:hypothetical protein
MSYFSIKNKRLDMLATKKYILNMYTIVSLVLVLLDLLFRIKPKSLLERYMRLAMVAN